MTRSAPRLETERLVLRDFTRDDLDAHAATLGDIEVMRNIGGEALTREDAMRRIFMAVGQWPVLGYGMWAVERKSDERMVGHVGFFDMARDIQPSLTGLPEMGWIFDTCVHGQGIAREACDAALTWLDRVVGPIEVPAIISLGNEASMKLAERLGFVREPDGIYKNEPIAIFRRPAGGR
ncbi:MAG: GNAT family N-acetyltransferase [Sphingomonas sp.]|nr:GNAT family N-acetyltransferase [Sphingomonas sp.]